MGLKNHPRMCNQRVLVWCGFIGIWILMSINIGSGISISAFIYGANLAQMSVKMQRIKRSWILGK